MEHHQYKLAGTGLPTSSMHGLARLEYLSVRTYLIMYAHSRPLGSHVSEGFDRILGPGERLYTRTAFSMGPAAVGPIACVQGTIVIHPRISAQSAKACC